MAEVIKMAGTVRSVNGIEPDANANVDVGENVNYFSCVAHSSASKISCFTDDNGVSWAEVTVKIPPILKNVNSANDVLIDRCYSKTFYSRCPPFSSSWNIDTAGWGGDNLQEHVVSIQKGYRDSESSDPYGHDYFDNDSVNIRYKAEIDGSTISYIESIHNLILAYVPKKVSLSN